MREILSLQNRWWRTGSVPKELLGSFKRDIFHEIAEDLSEKKITAILGPRRVGKTTLMHQLIDKLLKGGVDADRILYLQLDSFEFRQQGIIKELLTLISERVGEALDEMKKEVYFFLDEIQKLETWSDEIKQFHDMKLKIKFIVSGSSSLGIVKGSGESLLGRINHFLVLPMDFREFLLLKGINIGQGSMDYAQLKKTYASLLGNTGKIHLHFTAYLSKGGYPELLEKNKEEAYRLLIDSKDLSLQRDLFEIAGVRDVKSIKDLVSVVASLATERINYSKLGSILGIKADTVKRYIGLLEDIYLINEAKVFSKKPYFSVRKERKIFFMDCGMLNAINMKYDLDGLYLSRLVENACANAIIMSGKSITPSVNYWLDEYGTEVDFILEAGGRVIPIEVKFRNNILKKDLHGLKKFLNIFNCRTGLIITKDLLDRKITDGKEILFIPAWLFLLSL